MSILVETFLLQYVENASRIPLFSSSLVTKCFNVNNTGFSKGNNIARYLQAKVHNHIWKCRNLNFMIQEKNGFRNSLY